MSFELKTQNGNKCYEPVIIDGVTLTREKNRPAVLEFTVLGDAVFKVSEGNSVSLISRDLYPYNTEHRIFYGFVFKISPLKNGRIKITAYDQIRYLLSQDTYVYENKRLHELLWMICDDAKIKVGSDIEDTGYVIPSRIEDNKTYLDMILSGISLTKENTKKEYVLWDNFGEIALHNTEFFKLGTLIDSESGEDFSFETSIDSETFNQIKLVRENQETGGRDVFMKRDEASIDRWGLIQHFETLSDDENGDAKASSLLGLKNRRSRSFRVSKMFGDIRVRGGSLLPVKLDLGNGYLVDDFMKVRQVSHQFSGSRHTMDLDLTGGSYGD